MNLDAWVLATLQVSNQHLSLAISVYSGSYQLIISKQALFPSHRLVDFSSNENERPKRLHLAVLLQSTIIRWQITPRGFLLRIKITKLFSSGIWLWNALWYVTFRAIITDRHNDTVSFVSIVFPSSILLNYEGIAATHLLAGYYGYDAAKLIHGL